MSMTTPLHRYHAAKLEYNKAAQEYLAEIKALEARLAEIKKEMDNDVVLGQHSKRMAEAESVLRDFVLLLGHSTEKLTEGGASTQGIYVSEKYKANVDMLLGMAALLPEIMNALELAPATTQIRNT